MAEINETSVHCATCERWDTKGTDTLLNGHCPLHNCGFLLDGCGDWEEDENAHGCPHCGVRTFTPGPCDQCENRGES